MRAFRHPAAIFFAAFAVLLTTLGALALTPGQRVVVLSGKWSPLQLGGLAGFWRADVGVTSSSGTVSKWADQSPNAAHFTQTFSTNGFPTWSATGFNTSYPGVSFVPNQVLRNPSFNFSSAAMSAFALVSIIANSEVFAPYVYLNANTGGTSFEIANNYSNAQPATQPSLYAAYGTDTTDSVLNTPIGPQPNQVPSFAPALIGYVLNGTVAQTYLNCVPIGLPTSVSATIGSNPNSLLLGSQLIAPPSSANLRGVLAYLIMTAQAMSPNDVGNLCKWTNSNWGTNFSGLQTLTGTTDALDPVHTVATLSNGNLTATSSSAGSDQIARSLTSHSTGKWYFEAQIYSATGTRGSSTTAGAGLANGSQTTASGNGLGLSFSPSNSLAIRSGQVVWSGSAQGACPVLYGTNIIGIAVDFGGSTIQWYQNGTLCQTSALIATPPFFAAVNVRAAGDFVTINLGGTNFFYTPPAGYGAWN